MKLSLWYPAKPYRIHQVWGIKNPLYEKFGFSRHNGEDFGLDGDRNIKAEIPCRVVRIGYQPTGGGVYVSVISTAVYDEWKEPLDNIPARVFIDYLHMESISVRPGDILGIGDLIGIADNTGLSTGPHTHGQYRRVSYWNGLVGDTLAWTEADKNDANNSFDPAPYRNGFHADDFGMVTNTYLSLIGLYKQLLTKIS
jgi:murein DD-endopeptidase MepM/ murein hydrolase activator NlpD